MLGFVGAIVSIVIKSAEEVALFPAESLSVAVTLQTPSAKSDVNVQAPDKIVHDTLAEPAFAAVTVAVPVKDPETVMVGLLFLVMLSLFELPESESDARSGVAGIEGATLSLVIVLVAVAALAGPANALPDTEFAFRRG